MTKKAKLKPKKSAGKARKIKNKRTRLLFDLRTCFTLIGGICFGLFLIFLILLNPAQYKTQNHADEQAITADNFVPEETLPTNTIIEKTPAKATEATRPNLVPQPAEDVKSEETDSEEKIENEEESEVEPNSESESESETEPEQEKPEPKPTLHLWQQHALPVTKDIPADAKIVAVIIDDIGIDKKRTNELIAIPAPLTLSFLTYADDLPSQIKAAKQTGKELMLHIPMQPSSPTVNAGPNVLTTTMKPAEIADILNTALSPEILALGIAGVNNHMGSKFTSNKDSITAFMQNFKRYDLYFIDSMTHKDSYAIQAATAEDISAALRNIFIDNVDDETYILKQLAKLENVAGKNGYAIAIGHPHDGTISALKKWIPSLKAKKIYLVPASAVVTRRLGNKS